jgi:hypothetical protein
MTKEEALQENAKKIFDIFMREIEGTGYIS